MKKRVLMIVASILAVAGIAFGFQNCALETAQLDVKQLEVAQAPAPATSTATSNGRLEQVHFPKLKCNTGPLPLMIFGDVDTIYPGAGMSPESSSAKVNALQFCKMTFGNDAELVEYLEQNLFGDEAEGCSWAEETSDYAADFVDFSTGSRSKKPSFKGLARVTCRVP